SSKMVLHYVEPTGTESISPETVVPREEGHDNGSSDTSEPDTNSSQLSTPQETDSEPAKPRFSPRADRLNQKPSKGNAQGLFLPDACVFVGNLSIRYTLEQLEEDLTTLVSPFGKCHVKVRMSAKDKALPVGFVQFEDIKCAQAALRQNGELRLHNRTLRLESSKARRTAFFGYLTDAPISREEILAALHDRGCLESLIIKDDYVDRHGNKTTYGVVTFAYPDDFADALTHFNSSRKYYMTRTEMDANEGPGSQGYPAPGHRPSNQPTRGHQRYNSNSGRRPFNRPWFSGNNRGSFRNGPGAPPRHNASFSSNGGHSQNPSFDGRVQGHSPHDSFAITHHHNGNGNGNSFPQGFSGNFNPGYQNPNFNMGYQGNNFPQNYPGQFQQGYPAPNFVPPFSGPPVMMTPMPMAEFQPPPYPADYTPMPNPGYPMFMGNQPYQPPNYLPPIVTNPQPGNAVVQRRRRLPPNPDSPLIVSSQPQFDTEEHIRRYYEYLPANNYAGAQAGWVGNPGGYMHPGYNQPPPFMPNFQFPQSRHSSMESNKRNSPSPRTVIEPDGYDESSNRVGSESTLVQTRVDSSDYERGRQLARHRHANTDGASSVPASDKTEDRPAPAQAPDDSQEGVNPTDETQSAAPVTDNKTLDSQGNSTEPEKEPIHTGADENKEQPIDEAMASLKIESKHDESTGSSSEAGPKTPDTDESRECAKAILAASAAESSADTRTPDTAETLTPTDKGTPSKDKGKGKATATSTPTKPVARRLEPALPDDKHLLARHAFQHRKPLKKKYQPKTDTGKTVEQYTREINAQRAAADPNSRVPDHLLQEVIMELEGERREELRARQGFGPNDQSSTDSGPSAKK
ncbi:uncharacterized protein N7515_008575, partial [Penicillium bovifimosum]